MLSYWLLIPLLLFIGGLILHQVPLLLVSLLLFLTGGITKLLGRYSLSRVEYHRKLSSNRVFWGEEVQLEVEITNRKPLPLLWLQVDDEIPPEVTFLKGKTSSISSQNRSVLHNILSLSWYSKITRRYPLKCLQRGYFAFGPANISSGDFFGFYKKEMKTPEISYLTVYPRILPLEKLGIPARQPFGDIRLEKHLFQDPVLNSGVRDYCPGDSLKRIHWKTTARRGCLQTKTFEPTTTVDMGIFLNVRTVKPPLWGSVPELLELGIIAAASVSHYALRNGYRVGLYINQNRWMGREPAIKLAPTQHTDQQLRIMEALAQVHQTETIPMSRLILQEAKSLPWGSTIVVISAIATSDLLSSLIKVKRSGRRVALIMVGGSEAMISQDGLTVYRVRDEVLWTDLQTLAMDTAGKTLN